MPYAPLDRNQAHHVEIIINTEYRARLDRQRRQSDYIDAYPQPADTSNVALENRRRREREKDSWLWAYSDE